MSAILKGKVAIVTGGAKGIGGAVVVNYSSSADIAKSLCADIEKNGGFM